MDDDFEGKETQLIVEPKDTGERGGLIGITIDGKYRIVQHIARGGMGIVYLAEHAELERNVVVKVLAAQLLDDEAAYSRFKREAKGLSQLNHPNIVTIFDYGREDDIAYIVMEHIEGETLTQLLRRKGRLTYDEFLPIATQILDALGTAHRRDIVHRDIKPSNIMTSETDGREDVIKVLDFGLARVHGTSVDITKGNLVGTVAYLAPEVIIGDKATPTSDVYALGVMFYYLLTGVKPFHAADDMSVMYQHVNVNPTPLEELLPKPHAVPQEMIDLVRLCMSKKPKDRPIDANETLARLTEFASMPSFIERHSQITSGTFRHTPLGVKTAADPGPYSEFRSQSPSQFLTEGPNRIVVGSAVMVIIAVVLATAALWVAVQNNETTSKPKETIAAKELVKEQPKEVVVKPRSVLRIITSPVAEVKVDGKTLGNSPIRTEMVPGDHVLTISAEGHRTHSERTKLEDGKELTLSLSLVSENRKASAKPIRRVVEVDLKH